MFIENDIFLKSHVSCNFIVKYGITIWFRQFRKILTQYFYLSSANENLEVCTEAVVWRCSVKKLFLEISQNPQENTCARVSLKKRLWHRCFLVNFAKFLRAPLLQNTSSGCFSLYYSLIWAIKRITSSWKLKKIFPLNNDLNA